MRSSKPANQQTRIETANANKAVFGRYVIAGLINTFVSFIVYSLAIVYTPAEYWLANLLATIAGILCGFILARLFVFKSSRQSVMYSGPRYITTISIQYIVSTAAIGILVYFGISEIMAYILVLPLAVGLSYFLQKSWVFPQANIEDS